MTINDTLLAGIVLAFGVVSFGLTFKWIMESYLDYIQVKHGIRVITQRQMEEMMAQDAMEDDDETLG